MKIKDILKKHEDIKVCELEKIKGMTIYEVSRIFVDEDITALVITKEGEPYYFFTSTDIIDALVVHDEDLNVVSFIEKNPKKIITVTLNDTVFDAYTLMRSIKIHHLIVIDNRSKLVAVLKIDDLVSFLTEIAIKDELTGLYNKRFFDFILDKYRDVENEIGVIFVDINKFKLLNDTYGHIFGDKVLKEVSDTIKHSIREIDYAFRFGGDEFVIISFVSKEILEKIANRIKSKVCNTKIDNIEICVSVGAAHYPSDSVNIYEVVDIADKRMYEDKKRG